MEVNNLKRFVNFVWDFILDEPCSQDVLPEEWEVDEDGNSVVVEKAFEELDEIERIEPAIHAHWIDITPTSELDHLYRCSNCGWSSLLAPYANGRMEGALYCSHCGAKMNGRVDDEK